MVAYALFTDGSAAPRLKTGTGACLLLAVPYLKIPPENLPPALIRENMQIRRFLNTSSTALELRTALWALQSCRAFLTSGNEHQLSCLFTDSRNIADLPRRRSRLEAQNFTAKRSGLPLKNAGLYRRFYAFLDELQFEIIKVKGHTPAASRDTVHQIFSMLDREARSALKKWIATP